MFGPGVIGSLRWPPQGTAGNAVLAAQAIHDNADLLFSRILLARGAANVLDGLRRCGVWSPKFLDHRLSLVVTMSPKSSLMQ